MDSLDHLAKRTGKSATNYLVRDAQDEKAVEEINLILQWY